MAVWVIRLGILILSAAAIALAAVPLLVLIDLLDGGTGYGVCPAGLEACDNPYTTGVALAVLLTLGFLIVILGMRLLMRLARKLQSDEYQAVPRPQ